MVHAKPGAVEAFPRVSLLGYGWSVPAATRQDSDAELSRTGKYDAAETAFFGTTRERHYLRPDESIESFMVSACQMALADARLKVSDIDRLYGSAFVSRFISPNGLYQVHRALGLSERSLVVPVACEFSNFTTSLVLAAEAIRARAATHVLVACGGSLTRHVDYTRGHAAAIGDGAGAAVVSAHGDLEIVDHITSTQGQLFEEMAMGFRPLSAGPVPLDARGAPIPVYEMSLGTARTVGIELPPRLVTELLARHQIKSSDVALIGHQATRSLMDAWRDSVKPAEYFDTFDQFGNMSLASVPVTLALFHKEIRSPYVVLLSAGTGVHFTALLLRRCT